ncbi:Acyl-CoA thioesterase FadM [Hydrocarboniphaga daqingensis]|uniref:Acyl-CoA thioesterase FadM n=1 Tax=Hydrocarboniphaga daqingensis TaxID=490188 RepID=A0A1M5M2R9_9GAMM|nr:thioesterase family protein [Hydrocarboniphaga daqingensis]SHG71575.1 Acyl-CoA thioesterase FadM [Hydrocarboniphaga daqingensis]
MLRTLLVVLTSRLRGVLPLLGTSVLRLRVWPGDLDSNLHMNNGRYFSVADLGRFDHGLRSGLWRAALKRGWRPVAGDADGRFSVSLQPFARYQLHTRLLGWDDKWFFVEHRYQLGQRVAALVLVRYLFVSSRGPVPTAKVLDVIAHREPSPALPDWARQWRDAQNALVAQLKAESQAERPAQP